MKIRNISIHNVRSILDMSLAVGDYSLLVGSNNAGKSNVVDAIRMFYDKLKFDHAADFPKLKTADQESWIDIEFELDGTEATTIKKEYLIGANRFKVRRWLYPSERTKNALCGYENSVLTNTSFYGWKNVGQGKLGDVVYIPAVSHLEEHTKLSGPSVLRDLVNDILRPIVKGSSAFATLATQVGTFGQSIKQTETSDKRSLAGLEDRINQDLKPWNVQFGLDIEPPKEDDIVKTMIRPAITDGALKTAIDTDHLGHGLQRHLIYTLIRTAPDYVAADSIKDASEFAPSMTLLLFEEPEACLHPPQQDVLDTSLRRLSGLPDRQVLVTTHSPQFVSYNTDDLVDLIKVSKINGVSGSKQLSKKELETIFDQDLVVSTVVAAAKGKSENNVKKRAERELESVRHFLWLNPERSSIFFADFVLIVEGLSDQAVINYLIKQGEISTTAPSLFVIECFGKYNVHRFMTLLGALGVKHAVLHDSDSSKTGDDAKVQAALNKLITDSKNPCTTAIESLPDTLEAFLGLPPDHDTERWKAHRILLAVKDGKIDAKKREAFVKLVEGLLASSA